MLEACTQKINEEEAADQQYRAHYQQKWTVVASSEANQALKK